MDYFVTLQVAEAIAVIIICIIDVIWFSSEKIFNKKRRKRKYTRKAKVYPFVKEN